MPQDEPLNLLELERRAFELKKEGRVAEAAELPSDLLRREPSWEHGYGAYALALCLEDLQKLDAAKAAYLRALSHNSHDRIFMGGYASFLYLHGDATEAFDWHLKLLEEEWRDGDRNGCEQTKIAIRSLGDKLSLASLAVESAIKTATTQFDY